jgi:hypothetical protein
MGGLPLHAAGALCCFRPSSPLTSAGSAVAARTTRLRARRGTRAAAAWVEAMPARWTVKDAMFLI